MPASQGTGGINGNPYNALTLKPAGRPRADPTEPRWETIMALAEIEFISTYAEFAKVCEEQRVKRGW